ncbi:MAG: peptidylprolyl isomerase [Elusimicrobiota bacterium]|nr:peptidylprolyl isomerase [Elusimicrobiota bacterium]
MRFVLVFVMGICFFSCRGQRPSAELMTEKGVIVLKMFPGEAPLTVKNFVKLSKKGFYNGLTFHRVVKDVIVQGGDPSGNGSGGPGYTLSPEISRKLKHVPGTVSMARRPDSVNPGRRSSGSQFYICLSSAPRLDGDYTIFGEVTQGLDIAGRLSPGDKIIRVRLK